MNKVEDLKRMIEEAKQENDTVLVEHLTNALEHLTKKQIQPVERDTIIERVTHGNTIYTRYQSGKERIVSDYDLLLINANNPELTKQLKNVTSEIILEEIRTIKKSSGNAFKSFRDTIKNAKTQEDLNDIKKYLNDIAQIGPAGARLKEFFINIVNKEKIPNNIIETISYGNTTLNRYESGKTLISSDYFDVKSKANNPFLSVSLCSAIYGIAVDELNIKNGKELESIESFINIIKNAKTQEDINDIERVLNSIAKVGPTGAILNDKLKEYINNKKDLINKTENISSDYIGNPITIEKDKHIEETNNKESNSINENKPIEQNTNKETIFTNEIKKNRNKIALLDMRLDEINNEQIKDPDDYYDLAGKYEKIANDLISLIQLTDNMKKRELVKEAINSLNNKAKDVRMNAKKIEELGSSFRL